MRGWWAIGVGGRLAVAGLQKALSSRSFRGVTPPHNTCPQCIDVSKLRIATARHQHTSGPVLISGFTGFVLSACPAEHHGFSPLILHISLRIPLVCWLSVSPEKRVLVAGADLRLSATIQRFHVHLHCASACAIHQQPATLPTGRPYN